MAKHGMKPILTATAIKATMVNDVWADPLDQMVSKFENARQCPNHNRDNILTLNRK